MKPAVSISPSCDRVAPIFENYKSSLVRYIRSRIGDNVDQEEMVSAVLLKVYDSCDKLAEVRNLESWLITISKNAIADYYRKGKREQLGDIPDLPSEDKDDKDIELLTECLPGLIDKLPTKYGLPLRQYEFEGISQKELAKEYGLSESGLKSRVQRGRKMLRELFMKYCGASLECSGSCEKNC